MKIIVNKILFNEYLNTMPFLNEIAIKYPEAIPLNSGWGDETLYHVKERVECFNNFISNHSNYSGSNVNKIGHYSSTNGIINSQVAKMLENDENIIVSPSSIIITVGIQEAMTLLCLTIFNNEDTLLIPDPCYIGMPGISLLTGVNIQPLEMYRNGLNIEALENKIIEVNNQTNRVKAVYVIPNFHNPMGEIMDLESRKKLLYLSNKYQFFIIEDNPYGTFNYENVVIPTLKSIDKNFNVIYLGTFSKNLFPSLRLGYMVADQRVCNDNSLLSSKIAKAKSLISVNTSNIIQGMVGGLIEKEGYSLKNINEKLKNHYRKKRDQMLNCLKCYFPKNENWAKEVYWNEPQGGFFVIMSLPFMVTNKILEECASEFGVLFCPLVMFSITPNYDIKKKIRLSFSKCTLEEIDLGTKRLSSFVKNKLENMNRRGELASKS